MQWNSLFWTTLIATIITISGLKILQELSFIKWSPIGWAAKYAVIASSHAFVKWMFLFVLVLISYAIFFIIVSFSTALPESVTALFSTALIVGVITYLIHQPHTIREMVDAFSIAFFSLLAVISRFVVGTAVFMKKTF